MSLAEKFDSLSEEELRRSGLLKWSRHEGTLGMWVAEMDYGIAPAIEEELLRQAHLGSFGYLPARERTEIPAVAAHWFSSEFGADLVPEQTFLIPEVLEGLRTVIRELTSPHSPVIVPTPAYMPFLTIPLEFARRVIQVPSLRDEHGRWVLDEEGIEAAFAQGAELLILCNPWNPTGRAFSREELTRLAAIVDRHHGIVFEDAIHAPLVLPGASFQPYINVNEQARAHTVTAFAASKGWNIPGLKCAQLTIANPKLFAKLGDVPGRLGASTSTVGARVTRVAYESGGEWIAHVREYLGAQRDLLQQRVASWPGVALSPIEATYITFFDLRSWASRAGITETDGTIEDVIRERAGVDLTFGGACGQGYEQYLRMIFATSRPLLSRALDQMEEALTAAVR